MMWIATLCFHSGICGSHTTLLMSSLQTQSHSIGAAGKFRMDAMRQLMQTFSISVTAGQEVIFFRDPIVTDGSINSGYLFCLLNQI